jgi:hypothetical protein
MKKTLVALALVAPFAASPIVSGAALAHHSGAMFEPTLTRELHGTIAEFNWSNPHAWIEITVPAEDGGEPVTWAVEMTAPNNLMRSGWTRRTLTVGQEVVLTIRPLRDGGQGGTFVKVTTPEGVEFPAAPAAAAAPASPPGGEAMTSAAEHGAGVE